MLTWISRLIGHGRVNRRLSYLDRKIKSLVRARERSEYEIDGHRRNLQDLQQDFNEEIKKTRQALDRAAGVNKKLQAALDAAGEELDTAKNITIPGLVAASKVLTDQWDTQSSIFAARQAALQPAAKESFE